MILRPSYIEAVTPFIDQPLVKILAGVRRCGKSTIFQMLADEFRRRGVPEDRIIQKRYTEMDIPSDISAKDMYDDLKAQIQGKGRCYDTIPVPICAAGFTISRIIPYHFATVCRVTFAPLAMVL